MRTRNSIWLFFCSLLIIYKPDRFLLFEDVAEQSSLFNISELGINIDDPINVPRARSRSMYQTSTPKIRSNEIRVRCNFLMNII